MSHNHLSAGDVIYLNAGAHRNGWECPLYLAATPSDSPAAPDEHGAPGGGPAVPGGKLAAATGASSSSDPGAIPHTSADIDTASSRLNTLMITPGFHQSTPDSRFDIRDMLFKIVVKLNYNSAKGLRKLRKKYAGIGSGEVPQEILKETLKKVEYEREHNRSIIRASERTALPLTFGTRIQLLHVKTNKFLSVEKIHGADLAKGARKIKLIPHGDTGSVFKLQPVYRHFSPGDPVSIGETVALVSEKYGSNWCLNCDGFVLPESLQRAGSGRSVSKGAGSPAGNVNLLSKPEGDRTVMEVDLTASGFEANRNMVMERLDSARVKETRAQNKTPGYQSPFVPLGGQYVLREKTKMEVNLSMGNRSGWVVHLANRYAPQKLPFGQILRFYSPRSDSFFAASCKNSLYSNVDNSGNAVRLALSGAPRNKEPYFQKMGVGSTFHVHASTGENDYGVKSLFMILPLETVLKGNQKLFSVDQCDALMGLAAHTEGSHGRTNQKLPIMQIKNASRDILSDGSTSFTKGALNADSLGGGGAGKDVKGDSIAANTFRFFPQFGYANWFQPIALMHLASNRFLGITNNTSKSGIVPLELVDYCDPDRCRFELQPTTSTIFGKSGGELPSLDSNTEKLYLKHHRAGYVQCGEPKRAGCSDLGRGSSLARCSSTSGDDDVLIYLSVPEEEQRVVDRVIGAREQILASTRELGAVIRGFGMAGRKFVAGAEMNEEEELRIEAPFKNLEKASLHCVRDLVLAPEGSEEFATDSGKIGGDPDLASKGSGVVEAASAVGKSIWERAENFVPCAKVQGYCRELKVLDALLMAVSVVGTNFLCKDIKVSGAAKGILRATEFGDRPSGLKQSMKITINNDNNRQSADPATLETRLRKVRDRCGRQAMRALFSAIRLAFAGNPRNEGYVQQWTSIIIEYFSFGVGAEEVYAALCSDNLHVLRSLNYNVMERFCNFIRELGPDARFLHFMRNSCSVKGEGVEKLQDLILRCVYTPGKYASDKQIKRFGQSRKELLVPFILGGTRHTVGHIRGRADGALIGAEGGTGAAASRVSSLNPALQPGFQSKFLGHRLVLNGVSDIFVSWYAPPWNPKSGVSEAWYIGSKYLYNNPKTLDLECFDTVQEWWGRDVKPPDGHQFFVRLVDVLWPLCPPKDFRCHRHRYKALRRQANGGIIFSAIKILARWVLSQLELFSEITLGRSMNAVSALSGEMHHDLLLSGLLDHRLPVGARQHFCRLLTNVDVDHILHVDLEAPLEIRVVEENPDYVEDQGGLFGALCCAGGGMVRGGSGSGSSTTIINVTEGGSGSDSAQDSLSGTSYSANGRYAIGAMSPSAQNRGVGPDKRPLLHSDTPEDLEQVPTARRVQAGPGAATSLFGACSTGALRIVNPGGGYGTGNNFVFPIYTPLQPRDGFDVGVFANANAGANSSEKFRLLMHLLHVHFYKLQVYSSEEPSIISPGSQTTYVGGPEETVRNILQDGGLSSKVGSMREIRMAPDNVTGNRLTYELLRMLLFQIKFGFVSNAEQVKSLVFILLKALDGRTDVISEGNLEPPSSSESEKHLFTSLQEVWSEDSALIKQNLDESFMDDEERGSTRCATGFGACLAGGPSRGGGGGGADFDPTASAGMGVSSQPMDALRRGSAESETGEWRGTKRYSQLIGYGLYSAGIEEESLVRTLPTSAQIGARGRMQMEQTPGGGESVRSLVGGNAQITGDMTGDDEMGDISVEESTQIRYSGTERNKILCETKTLLCDSLSELNNLVVDSMVTRLLTLFLDHQDALPLEQLENASSGDSEGDRLIPDFLVDKILSQLSENPDFDYDVISRLPMKTVVLDLLLYNNRAGSGKTPPLFESALNLLFSVTCRLDLVLETASGLQVLQSGQDVHIYQYIKEQVHLLQSFAEAYERWGQDTDLTRTSWVAVEKCAAILIELRQLCSKLREEEFGTGNVNFRRKTLKDVTGFLTRRQIPVGGVKDATIFIASMDTHIHRDSNEPDEVIQDILRSLGLRRILLEWLTKMEDCCSDSDSQPDQDHLDPKSPLKPIMCLVSKLTAQMVRSHGPNQMEAFEYIFPLLDAVVWHNVGAEALLDLIFRNNQEIVVQADYQHIFTTLGRIIIDEYPARNAGFLRVFQNLILVNGALIPVAKRLFLEKVQAPEWRKVICSFPESPVVGQDGKPPAGQKLGELEQNILGFSWTAEQCQSSVFECLNVKHDSDGGKALYYREWMLLLGGISTGRDIVCETLVQSLAPGHSVMDQFLRVSELLPNRILNPTGVSNINPQNPPKKLTESGEMSRVWLCLQIKCAQLCFLDEGYCESDVKPMRLLISKRAYKVVDTVARDLEDIAAFILRNSGETVPSSPEGPKKGLLMAPGSQPSGQRASISEGSVQGVHLLTVFDRVANKDYLPFLEVPSRAYLIQACKFIASYLSVVTQNQNCDVTLTRHIVATLGNALRVFALPAMTEFLIRNDLQEVFDGFFKCSSLVKRMQFHALFTIDAHGNSRPGSKEGGSSANASFGGTPFVASPADSKNPQLSRPGSPTAPARGSPGGMISEELFEDTAAEICILPARAYRLPSVSKAMEALRDSAQQYFEGQLLGVKGGVPRGPTNLNAKIMGEGTPRMNPKALVHSDLANEAEFDALFTQLISLKYVLNKIESVSSGASYHDAVGDAAIAPERVMTVRFRAFVAKLAQHPKVKEALEGHERSIIDTIENIRGLSDANDSKYETDKLLGRTDEVRTNIIHTQTVLSALITYGLDCLREHAGDKSGVNWTCIDRIIKILLNWVQRALECDTPEEIQRIQTKIGSIGGVSFVLAVLDFDPPIESLNLGLELGIALLEGGNSNVQHLFKSLFETMDDMRCFTGIRDMYQKVLGRIKRYRSVKETVMGSQETLLRTKELKARCQKWRKQNRDRGHRGSVMLTPRASAAVEATMETVNTVADACKKSFTDIRNAVLGSPGDSCCGTDTPRGPINIVGPGGVFGPAGASATELQSLVEGGGSENSSARMGGENQGQNQGEEEDFHRELISDVDFEYMRTFRSSVEHLNSSMRFLQLLCEGHNSLMQDYLREQSDNSETVDVLQLTTDLISKFCKSEGCLDVLDEVSADCLSQGLELLIEMVQGPCSKNQANLAVNGCVEVLMRILNGKFTYLNLVAREVSFAMLSM